MLERTKASSPGGPSSSQTKKEEVPRAMKSVALLSEQRTKDTLMFVKENASERQS